MEKMKFFHRSVLVICCCITKHSTTYRLKPVVYYYATQLCGLSGFLLGVFCEAVVRCHLGLQSHRRFNWADHPGWCTDRAGGWCWFLAQSSGDLLSWAPICNLSIWLGLLMVWQPVSKKDSPKSECSKDRKWNLASYRLHTDWHMVISCLFYGSKQCQGPPGFWRVGPPKDRRIHICIITVHNHILQVCRLIHSFIHQTFI